MEAVEQHQNGPQQLSLQWHHHHKTLVSLLDLLWERQELVDVTLAAEGQYIQVHRIVLCACSKYFQDILTHNGNSDKHAIVFLKDVYFHDLKALVHYMYKGEVRINEDQLNSFLHTAKSLGIHGLMGSDVKKDQVIQDKRMKYSSSESNEEYSCEEDEKSVGACHQPAAPLAPPPPPLKHMTSLTKNLDIKTEVPSACYEDDEEMVPEHSQPGTADFSESLRNASNITAHELDDEGLGLFACADDDPGPSRTSEDENNHNGQDCYGYWEEQPSTSIIRLDGSRRIPCPQCHRDYSTVDLMKRHLRYECGVEPKFQCPICLKRTKHKHNLHAHMKTHLNQNNKR